MTRIPLPGRLARYAAAVGVVCGLLVALLLGPGTDGERSHAVADSTYRVDVIFDTAKGIIPGQLVKIAGARVGRIKDVVLTPDFKARVQMEVDRRFAPFRKDAKCEIQPEGLISERFVQCDPGTAAAGELVASGGHPATVPVTRTAVPVAITDLFNIFRVPVRQRLSVVLTSLGISVAGRGEDINDILRRANPAIATTRKVLAILSEQRKALKQTVSAGSTVVGDLAARPQAVTDFLDGAAKVTRTTGDHHTQLAAAIRHLPNLLDETEPTLARLDEVSAAGGPVLRNLRTATPGLSGLVNVLPSFTEDAKPALTALAKVARTGRKTTRAALPVTKQLKMFAAAARPTGNDLNKLLVNLQQRGGIEQLLNFTYSAAAATSRYDQVSHLLPARLIFNACASYAETPVSGCSANYGKAATQTTRSRTGLTPKPPVAATTKPKAAAPAATTTSEHSPTVPAAPADDKPKGTTIQIPGLPPITLPSIPGLLQGVTGGHGRGATPVGDLLQYLLGD